MANYSIFALGESQISISGGGQLDGVTQGDGSHLLGRTITLNSNAWTEMRLRDTGDSDFSDNDSDQRLQGAQTFDGTSYANNTGVEAEYGLTLSDGVNTWTAIGFNLNNSSPSYATIEGLAFIGGPGGFPPIGVPLTVIAYQEGPSFNSGAYATPICFAQGTLIATGRGPRPVETLRPGDMIQTADNGMQPLRWAGRRHTIGAGRFAPVEIAAGVLGADRPLRVSQQHRILIRSAQAELLFGEAEVFVAAGCLIDDIRVRLRNGVRIEYCHLLLDRHEVIFANGVASESLHLAEAGGGEVGHFFPDLADIPVRPGVLARRDLRRHEAELLLAHGPIVETETAMRHIA
jgi:hypothetical protein